MHKVIVKQKKVSIYYNLPLQTHDEDHFYHAQIFKLASGTYTEWILNRDKIHNEICQKLTKKLLQRQNIHHQIILRFTPATDLKIRTFVLIPKIISQKGISEKSQPIRNGPYQIIDKPTDVTYKLTDSNKKEIIQHRNNLLPYYPKEYALRELTQLYSFTGLKIVQNNSDIEQNQNTDKNIKPETNPTKRNSSPNISQNINKNISKRKKEKENDRKNLTKRSK